MLKFRHTKHNHSRARSRPGKIARAGAKGLDA
jgi:hypothetical protein